MNSYFSPAAPKGILSAKAYSLLSELDLEKIEDVSEAKNLLKRLKRDMQRHSLVDNYITIPEPVDSLRDLFSDKKMDLEWAGDHKISEELTDLNNLYSKPFASMYYDCENEGYFVYVKHFSRLYRVPDFPSLSQLLSELQEFAKEHFASRSKLAVISPAAQKDIA